MTKKSPVKGGQHPSLLILETIVKNATSNPGVYRMLDKSSESIICW